MLLASCGTNSLSRLKEGGSCGRGCNTPQSGSLTATGASRAIGCAWRGGGVSGAGVGGGGAGGVLARLELDESGETLGPVDREQVEQAAGDDDHCGRHLHGAERLVPPQQVNSWGIKDGKVHEITEPCLVRVTVNYTLKKNM